MYINVYFASERLFSFFCCSRGAFVSDAKTERDLCSLSYLDPPWLFSVPLATPSSFLPFCICVRMSIGEGLGHG